ANLQMRRIDPGIMIIGEELVMAKYDTDKDGKLSDEEKKAMREDWAKDHPEAAKRMEEMKARQEAHAANMIKKFDKDGDGKLSPEELQAIPPHHGQPGPHHAAPGGPKGPGAPKMDGPRRPGGPRAEGPRAPRGPEGRRGGEGRRGDGDRGPRGNRPDGPRPQLDPNRAPIMAAGWILIEEKYDADKDGKLNEAEMAQLNADASKALEARRSARREARKAARGNNDMPLPPAPVQEEGDDE
ncbi:EF-hand domain-containing protein, partial [Akkermansia sp.]